MRRKNHSFTEGIRAGIPVFIGYFSASIAFGLLAVSSGLEAWEAILFSVISTTGAGQFMSINLIVLGVSPFEAVFSVFLLNIRYMLMSMSLSLKIDFTGILDRLLIAYWVTDENFSVISAREGKVPTSFVFGLQLTAYTGWIGGTALGALGSSLLPRSIQEATGVALYALFASLLVPEVKKEKKNILIALLAGILNTVMVLLLHWPMGWAFVAAMLIAATAGFFLLIEQKTEVKR